MGLSVIVSCGAASHMRFWALILNTKQTNKTNKEMAKRIWVLIIGGPRPRGCHPRAGFKRGSHKTYQGIRKDRRGNEVGRS